MHCLADVQHSVEDDRVSGGLHLVSAGDKETNVDEWHHFYFLATNQNKSHYFIKLLLDEDLHDGPADLHPHAVLLEHV